MQIHKLFNNMEEYKDYFWSFLKHEYCIHSTGDGVWKEEDKPLLDPFFNYSNETGGHSKRRGMTKEEGDSFDFYMKCRKEYADEAFEKRDAIAQIDDEVLFEGFFLKYPGCLKCDRDEEDDCVDEITIDILKDVTFLPIENKEITFPLILVGTIESDRDRVGKFSYMFLDIVELKEFKV